jgi:molybdate transport system regulatory protein
VQALVRRRRAKAIVVRMPNSRGDPSLHLRLDFGGERSLGPGKVQLLELVGKTGSISAAGRALKMSYPQAWRLIDELNRMFRRPLVIAQVGGGGGGGTALTKAGAGVIQAYRDMEKRTGSVALSDDIRALVKLLA